MLETAADWSVFLDPAEFGEAAVYRGAGQPPMAITGIFTAAVSVIAEGGYAGVSSTTPVFSIGTATLPFAPRVGDTMTLRARTWRVADLQPDGTGLIRITLEEA